MSAHKPDAEMKLMQRVLRELASLSTAGRRRVLSYLTARVETLPPLASERNGEQQLDLEEATS